MPGSTVDDGYLPLPGEVVAADALRLPRARELVELLRGGDLDFVRLVGCRRHAESAVELVVFDVDVELGQRPVHAIRRRERIAATFDPDDTVAPEVQALRADFPLVPHVNLRAEEFPRSLCLSERPWCELRLGWTAHWLVERTREWLALTADGSLHQPDQPLEPLLWGSPWPLVLPICVVEQTANGRGLPLVVHCVDAGLDRRVFVAREPDNVLVRRGGLPCVVIAVTSQPRPHGIIRSQPPTLRHLHDFLADGGVDLVGQLRERLRRWRTQRHLDGFSLIVVVALPKSRQIGGPAEDTEYRAFLCDRELARLRPEIGLVRRDGRAFGAGIVDGVDRVKMGEAVGLLPLDVTFSLGRDRAAELNGREAADGRRIVAVGVGALGSQVVMNLVRAGWGTWTLIDDDVLLPHNLARHASIGPAVGAAKVASMQTLANWVVDGNPVEHALVADVLAPERNAAQVGRALGAADAILDCSASVAVARHLARDVASPARRASFFLNPAGTDAVLLVEDAERTIPLDALEMQYYRTLIERPQLAGHLDPGSLPFRYGGSCRDVTTRLPQDAVALFAALGSRALSVALDRPGPTILIWQANAEQLDVRSVRIQPQPVVVERAEEWQIATDRGLLDVVAARRRDRLPNETGGVLVGAIDTLHRTVYVVDAIPSPPDSTEWPTLYIRGYEGLTARLREIGAITRGMLEYVGEWHAHPNGHGCTPSKDDREAFAWLAQERRRDGRMPLMLIAGEDRFCWYLGRMPGRP